MNDLGFRGRVEHVCAAEHVDIAFRHTGDIDNGAKELTVRIQSAPEGSAGFVRQDA